MAHDYVAWATTADPRASGRGAWPLASRWLDYNVDVRDGFAVAANEGPPGERDLATEPKISRGAVHDGDDELEKILAAGGRAGELMRSIDWAATPLGPPRQWPQSLRSTLSICLGSRFPIALHWGPQYILLFNDAYIPILGSRHATALGRPTREGLADVWDVLRPRFERVFHEGRTIAVESALYVTQRHGYDEECYLDYSLSPIRGENDRVVGIYGPVLETTRRVLSERRSRVLHSLAVGTAGARSAEQVCALAADILAAASADVPFCVLYLMSEDNRLAYLAAAAGFPEGCPACPDTIATAGDSRAPWPLDRVFRSQQPQLVEPLSARLPMPAPGGPWPEPARAALVLPINESHSGGTVGFLVLGLSPRLEFDEAYQAFATAIADGIASAISNARKHDRERSALRARLAKLASVAPVAIFEFRLGPDGRVSIPYSTPAIAEIYGHTPEEIAADATLATSLNHPDDRARLEQSLRKLEPVHDEWRVLHPTKGEIWIEVRSTPERQPDGGVVWYGYIHDITERRRMEDELREREARFRQLAENIQECFWLVDPRTQEVLYVSPAYETIWGRASAELQRSPTDWLNGVHPDDRKRVTDAIALRVLGRYNLEYRVVRPDGTIRVIHDRAFPIRDAAGAVYRIAGIAEDVTTQKKRERQIRFLAYHDALTRLPNRALLANRLRQAIAQTQRNAQSLAVMFLDIDRFKTINDSLGHGAGDSLLQQVAERLTDTLRVGDTVARAGGDEFLLLIPDLHSPEHAALVAEHLLACLSAPFIVANQTLRVTGSVGISVCPRDASDVQTLIKYADTALYLAKEQGRNTFRFFSPELDAKVRARMTLENDLRAAVDRGQFLLHYQPQIELATGRVIGVEALLRWLHPQRGLVLPGDFITVAEETGLILPIGEWALRTACRQARAWGQQPGQAVRICVNISGKQLNGNDIIGTVRRILAETDCDPHLIGLEITESTVMEDPREASTVIRALHELGIEIAIDDFGTGYSSLAYLKRFALDRLKIDAGFIHGIPQDTDDIAIVQATIALARRFRLQVTAEGVETEAQQSFLRENDCDAVQGFLISRPKPGQDLKLSGS